MVCWGPQIITSLQGNSPDRSRPKVIAGKNPGIGQTRARRILKEEILFRNKKFIWTKNMSEFGIFIGICLY